ncbi:MAG: hypothetical protein RIR70_2217 [Pseudomonadota bacterium]|jgi:ATP-binding cassette subfamily F protein 3
MRNLSSNIVVVVIVFQNLTLARGARTLIEGANLQIHPGWRVGLTGANGCGKSSLMAALRGELFPERGELARPAQWVVAHVAQDTPALPTPAIEFTLDGDAELRELEALLAGILPHEGVKMAELHERMQTIGAYGARARAAALLHGLGFRDEQFDWPVAKFSGGWRVRLNLARALMCRSDLLLLDEPTNHLDLEAVVWLESWLREYRGTLMLISHDRDFLDAVVGHIAHIEGQRLTLYTGHYSDFERQRAARLANQQASFEAQQRTRAHLQKYIDRFRAQATKARQAQSRIKALGRMEEIAAAHVDTPFTFSFREPGPSPDPLLVLEDAAAGYGGQAILSGVNLTLRPGCRVGLLGANGAGKSTLIKLLAGESATLVGERREGKGLLIGYFAQHQLEQLRADESPLQHLQREASTTREQVLRDYLGGFDFRGETVETPIARFSGGEKSRLALALLIWRKPNLLLLDEPTNHLDLEMREALTLALNEFEGGVVVVSHDRHLLRTTVDEFLLVEGGRVTAFDGDLEDYRTARQAAPAGPAAEDASLRRQQRESAQADRQAWLAKRRDINREIAEIEKKLARFNDEKTSLETRLAAADFYTATAPAEVQESLKRQAQLQSSVEGLEMDWLAAQEALEALGEEPGRR